MQPAVLHLPLHQVRELSPPLPTAPVNMAPLQLPVMGRFPISLVSLLPVNLMSFFLRYGT